MILSQPDLTKNVFSIRSSVQVLNLLLCTLHNAMSVIGRIVQSSSGLKHHQKYSHWL